MKMISGIEIYEKKSLGFGPEQHLLTRTTWSTTFHYQTSTIDRSDIGLLLPFTIWYLTTNVYASWNLIHGIIG